jgi:hypothetical protein
MPPSSNNQSGDVKSACEGTVNRELLKSQGKGDTQNQIRHGLGPAIWLRDILSAHAVALNESSHQHCGAERPLDHQVQDTPHHLVWKCGVGGISR